MEINSKIQAGSTNVAASNKNDVNNNSSMFDKVPVSGPWNAVNTNAIVNTSSANIQTFLRNVIFNKAPTDNVPDNISSYRAPMMYTGRPAYTDRSTFNAFNVCTLNNFNMNDPSKTSQVPMSVQSTFSGINQVQTSANPVIYNSAASNTEPSRINATASRGAVMPTVVISEDPQGSTSLIRPGYFVPGQAQLKTLDDEGIKMMKSGNKILLPRLEGAQGFVVQGPSQVLQATNKTNDGNLASKPDYSYASMICQAIFASPEKKSTLAEIYERISTTYPFFKRNQQGWKNSIRHNLSLNVAFVRASRGEGATGKGGYWTVDPTYECYFVNGHFKPPSNEAKGSCKRARSDENEMATNTNTTVTRKKHGGTQNPMQIVRRQVKDNIEAAVQITFQLRGEDEVISSKKKARVEVENVTKVTSAEGTSTDPEESMEKMIRSIAEGCEEVYRRYYDGNDPNWRGDTEFFASFSPFL